MNGDKRGGLTTTTKAKVMIVEDEIIIAEDIRNMVTRKGYEVPAIVDSGEEAIEKAEAIKPDLILMDNVLKGEIDGIEAAEEIRTRLGIPVVYLTSFAEEKTVERAKVTEPFGYLLKPFEERELHTAIEIALYKYKLDAALRESEERFRTFFDSLPIGAVMLDQSDRVLAASSVFCRLLAYTEAELVGRDFSALTPPEDRDKSKRLYHHVLTGEGEHYSVDRRLVGKDREIVWTRIHASAIRNEHGSFRYATVIVEDLTEFKRAEELSLLEKMALENELAECKRIVGHIAEKRAKEE